MRERVRLQRDRHAPRPSSRDTRDDGLQATPSPSPGPTPSHVAGFHFGAIDIASKEQVTSMAADPLQRRTHLFVRPTEPRWERRDAVSLQRAHLGGRIRTAQGGGRAIESGVQQRLEMGLGADLAGVRVHTDGEADALSRSVQAVALTTGRDIFFRSGAYNPQSSEGMRLLAHEATHTVQQAQGPVEGTPTSNGVSLSDPADRFERAAEASAARVMQLQRLPAVRDGGADPLLQRQIRVEPRAPLGGPVPVQRNGEGDFLREALWDRRKAVGMLTPEEERRVQYEEFASAAGERETADAGAFQGTGSVRRRAGALEHAEALARTAGARETQEAATFQGTGSVRRRAARLDYLENLLRGAGARETAEAGTIHPTPLTAGQTEGIESLIGLRVGHTESQSKKELTTRSETFSLQVVAGERVGVPLQVGGAGATTPQQMAANLGRAIAGVGVTWELGGTRYNNADRNEGGGQILSFSTNIRVPRWLTVKGTAYRLSDHVIANLLLPRDAAHEIKLEEVEKALETRGTGDPRWDGQQFQGSKLTVKVGGDGTIVTAFYDARLWNNSPLPERYKNWLQAQQKAASAAKLKEVSAAWTDEVFERFKKALEETKNNQTRAAEKIGINSRRPEFYKAYRTWAATK